MIIFSNISKLYDGTSTTEDAIKHGVDLHIDQGKIKYLKDHDPRLEVGSEHIKIDASELTITPGLIDCHGHITTLGISSDDLEVMHTNKSWYLIEKILYTTLVKGGVTTLRDVGGATHFMKRMVDEGVMIGPRLKIAICMLSTTGGHADFRGPDRCHAQLNKIWPAGPGRPSSIVDGPWECRKRVREIAACGADVIKLCTSPGVASPSDKLEHQDFTHEEIQAICDEAAARGLKVAAHAHSLNGIEMAIDCGVHDIQHISFMDERLVEKAYDKGCVVTPTSWVVNDLLDAKDLTDEVMEKVKKVADVHRSAVRFASQGGLPILSGTDAILPGMHGRNYMEMVHLIDDGLSPLAAWYGMTGLAAKEINQEDAGTLKEGQRADLLICKGDVINNPSLLEGDALIEVMKDGYCYRDHLKQLPQKTFNDIAIGAVN